MLSTNSRAARPSSGRSARNQTTHALAPRALLAGSLAFALIACAPAAVTPSGGTGGKNGSGGSSSGGAGGNGNGGSGSGGSNNGGSNAQGGSNNGGSAQGGSNNGGSNNGGSNNGGSAQGGSNNGGSNNGGSNNGGSAGGNNNGGSNAGGANNGGSSAGGSNNGGSSAGGSNNGGSSAGGSNNGGSAAGGSGAGGSGAGANPAGYYMTKDWGVTSVDWHGCAWTGIDVVAGTTTKVTPQDFTSGVSEGGPYHVTGTVFNNYNSVALLGFNLNEAVTGKSDQCKYNPAAATADGPPGVTFPTSTTGIAFNWGQGGTSQIRIQIQASDGATNAAHRWCYNVTGAGGASFAPYTQFNTACWGTAGSTTNPLGTYYDGSVQISAVVFLIAGDATKLMPFDFTVNGFAPGNSAADAPKGGATVCGKQTGSVGSSTVNSDATTATNSSMARALVSGSDCKQYIINNNNWGSEATTAQLLNFTGTSFTVANSTGNVTGQGVPAAFPSTYIGGNGDLGSTGTYNTWSDSGLPKQISAMKSAISTFNWSGGGGGKDFNATYDIWFAASPPTAGGYNDGVSALLMVWFYKPGSRTPIGSVVRSGVTVSGIPGTWDVYAGKRNTTAKGATDLGRPVISYVSKSTLNNSPANFDLKKFFDDAATNGTADQGKAGTSIPFSSSLYLTDVFAGFEIWTGGDATGLQSTGFTCVVQ